jgi:hypothetical protein
MNEDEFFYVGGQTLAPQEGLCCHLWGFQRNTNSPVRKPV